jgi:uncharacterized membrane protein
MKKRRKEYVDSTPARSFIKAFTWETIAFLITLIAAYLFYDGDIKKSIKFSIILTGIKIIFLYFHERVWKRIIWGRIRC